MRKKIGRREFLNLIGVTSGGLVITACGVKDSKLRTSSSKTVEPIDKPTSTTITTVSSDEIMIQRNINLIANAYKFSSTEEINLHKAVTYITNNIGKKTIGVWILSLPLLAELGFTDLAHKFKKINESIPLIFKNSNETQWKTADIATWCRECNIEFRTRETTATSSTYGNNARGEAATTIPLDFAATFLGVGEEYSYFNRDFDWKSIINDIPNMIEKIKKGEGQLSSNALGRLFREIDIIRDNELVPFGIHEYIGHTLLGGVELIDLEQIKHDMGLSYEELANLCILFAATKILYMAKPRKGENQPFMNKAVLTAEVSGYLLGLPDVKSTFINIGGYDFVARLEDVCQQAYTSTYHKPLEFIIAEDFAISEKGMIANSDLRDHRDTIFKTYLPSLRAAGVKAPYLLNELFNASWTHDPPTEEDLTKMFQDISNVGFLTDAPDFVAVRGNIHPWISNNKETMPLGNETEDERALGMLQTIFGTYLKNGINRLGMHSIIDTESKTLDQLEKGLPSAGLAPYEIGTDGVARRTPAYYVILNAIFQNTPKTNT